MENTLLVGGGHSMGGMQIVTQQAAHRTFERLIVIGYTALGVHLTIGDALVSADPGPLDLSSPQYVLAQRDMLRSTFHWEDVPDDVVAVDDSLLVEVPYVLSAQSLTTGIIAADAGAIDVPVLISLGQRDVSPSPHDEPACYRSSPDVTLHILPRSAHCQSFATTRHELYARIDGWLRSLEA
jgi:pimeloyl-ACP methyl ester carboxylesterase